MNQKQFNNDDHNSQAQYTPAYIELLELISNNGPQKTADELMLIHDIALYHSDKPIDEQEKSALYQIKQMAGLICKISENLLLFV